MEYRYSKFFRLLNSFIDFIILNLSLLLTFYLLGNSANIIDVFVDHEVYFLVSNLLWFFCSSQTKLYEKILNTEAVPYLRKSIWTLSIFSCFPLFLNLIHDDVLLTPNELIATLSVFWLCILSSKILFLLIRKSQRRFWVDYKEVVILGSGYAARELYDYFNSNNGGYLLKGYFADTPNSEMNDDCPYLGSVEESVAYAADNGISEIFSALPSSKVDLVRSLIDQADHNLIRFRLVPDMSSFIDRSVLVEYCGVLPVLTRRKEPLDVKFNEIIKSSFDYVFSFLVAIFVLSWLTPIIAIAIKLDSKGPVLFRQLRSGKDNKPFYCLKFRSMYVNGEADTTQASKNDSRITRVGAFLRKTSLDEIPQFFNVLMGDMSIVGPRPHMLKHTESYSQVVNGFMVRQFATPGITGWAQINGLRGETKETETMTKRVNADIWYMENWSFLLDLKIVFLTVWQSLKRNEKAF